MEAKREIESKEYHLRLRENAGAREESQVPDRRGNETPGTNNKQANKNRHPPSSRRLPARGAFSATIFEFPGSSDFTATWNAKQKTREVGKRRMLMSRIPCRVTPRSFNSLTPRRPLIFQKILMIGANRCRQFAQVIPEVTNVLFSHEIAPPAAHD